MNATSNSDDLDLVFSDTAEEGKPNMRRSLIRAAVLTAVLVALSGAMVIWVLGARERQVIADIQSRADILATTRAKLIEGWLDTLGDAGYRITRSDLFRLFAAEIGLSGTIPPRDSPLAAQLPYMVQAVTDLARQEHFAGVYLIDREGRAVLASGGAPELTLPQRESAKRIYEIGRRTLSGARGSAQGLVLDVLLPIGPPQQSNPGVPAEVVGVVLITVPIQTALGEKLAPLPLATSAERTRLVQHGGSEAVELDPFGQPMVRAVPRNAALSAGESVPFGRRLSLGGSRTVFSNGVAISGAPWVVIQEIRAAAALAPLRTFRWTAIGFATLVTVALVVVFAALWWRQASEHGHAMAAQFRDLATRINAHRRFLDSLMSTVHEWVGLKRMNGTYIYVNPAFARSVDRPTDQIVGLDDAALFGLGTARRLAHSDARALETADAVLVDESLYLPTGPRQFQFSKVPYRDQDGSSSAILTVARDVTDIREAERRRQETMRQMTQALVRTVEMVDPYLAGHTQNVQRFSMLVGRAMNLAPTDLTTLEIAANLAQIGKVGLPREVVAKNERLIDAEIQVMQGHIDNALAILSDIRFDLPVIDTIVPMYERLDGSGYPKGLKGDAINLRARILGTCDVFCARIERRSYREAITADEALRILEQNAHKYDVEVVAMLRAVVRSIEGEKLLQRIQNA